MTRVAIYTRYSHSERTRIALQLSRHIQNAGGDVSVYAAQGHIAGVDPYWDSRVLHSHKRNRRRNWWEQFDAIVWFEVPRLADVQYMQQLGLQAVYWCNWHDLRSTDRPVLSILDHMFVPTASVARALALPPGMRRGRVWRAPPALLPPAAAATPPADRHSVVVPLHADMAFYVLDCWLDVVAAMLAAGHMVTVTRGSGWPVAWVVKMKQLQKAYGGRLLVLRNPGPVVWRQLLRSATGMVYLGFIVPYGTFVLDAVATGVPVIALDIEPASNYIRHKINGYLLSCAVLEHWNGLPAGVLSANACVTQVLQALEFIRAFPPPGPAADIRIVKTHQACIRACQFLAQL